MSFTTGLALIVSQIGSLSLAMFLICDAIIGLAVGFLVFRWGWKSLMNLPGGSGYNPSYGSGISRFRKTKYEGSGGHMKSVRF